MMPAKTLLLSLLLPCILLLGQSSVSAQETGSDAGKEKIGKIRATIYYGTDGAVDQLGAGSSAAPDVITARLKGITKMRFKNYRKLGSDTQSVLRSYENWVSPLKPSEEIMLSFESRGVSDGNGLRLDLELWQHKRKVMKSDPVLYQNRPLYILGPKWRGGRLIIAVELIALTSQ